MKDGTFRFSVNYRRLNVVNQRDLYHILRMDECVDFLEASSVFSTLLSNSDYQKWKMSDKGKDKTLFTTHHDLYRFPRMFFGLKNTPGTFQRAIDVTTARVK